MSSGSEVSLDIRRDKKVSNRFFDIVGGNCDIGLILVVPNMSSYVSEEEEFKGTAQENSIGKT